MMIGVQADDLTGACDTGATFAARGLSTVVLLPDAPSATPTADVLVLDTESRSLPRAEARRRARDAAARLAAEERPTLLYKKVDSTLRGAVAAELGGALEGCGRPYAILAPAFPGQGRVVMDGILRVDGRRVDESPMADDPDFPATGASVLALLGADGPHPVGSLPLATVRRGPPAVTARLARWADSARGALVCDAETDADLDALAAAAGTGRGGPALLAGSAGLAAALAARMRGGPPATLSPLRRPLLVVAGSPHPATRAQVERLRARRVRNIIAAPPPVASESASARAAQAAQLGQDVRQRLLTTGGSNQPATLLLTGGETAVAVCRALGASGIRLAGEAAPGLARGALLDGPFAGLAVLTKAGGFGDADALVRVWEACV